MSVSRGLPFVLIVSFASSPLFPADAEEPFVPSAVRRCLSEKPVPLLANFRANPFYFRADFSGHGRLETLVMVMTRDGQRGWAYCSGGVREVAWDELWDDAIGRQTRPGDLGPRGLSDNWVVLDPREARAALGASPARIRIASRFRGSVVFVLFEDVINVFFREGNGWRKDSAGNHDSDKPGFLP